MAGCYSVDAGNQFVGLTPKRFIDARSSLGPAPENKNYKQHFSKMSKYRFLEFLG